MKSKLLTICLFIAIVLSSSNCNEEKICYGCDFPRAQLYKLRGDYIKNVCVSMSKDKSHISGYPSPGDPAGDSSCLPLELIDGYYLDTKCNYGIKSGYLSITREDFISWSDEVDATHYKDYLLDTDPYSEYYLDLEIIPNDSCSFDTLCLNRIIRNHLLETYFERIK